MTPEVAVEIGGISFARDYDRQNDELWLWRRRVPWEGQRQSSGVFLLRRIHSDEFVGFFVLGVGRQLRQGGVSLQIPEKAVGAGRYLLSSTDLLLPAMKQDLESM